MRELRLPSSFEEVVNLLGGGESLNAQLMRFVQPVAETEKALMEVIATMRGAGKTILLHGLPGTGKSTFIQSLSWRTHLGIHWLKTLDATSYGSKPALEGLARDLRAIGSDARRVQDAGVTMAVINYLEHLQDFDEAQIRGFFRSLNGILRQFPLLVLWPVTDRNDAEKMLQYASAVSGTVFHRGHEIIEFSGPGVGSYVSIAESTIGVLNDGRTLEDFGLTKRDAETVLESVKARGRVYTNLRNYYEDLRGYWSTSSRYLIDLQAKIPKATEVWFVFSYPTAETVTSQFSRKSTDAAEAWKASHSKLYEYLHDNQRSADWDPRRLQFAIGGALTTRIMYLPTNALVSCIAAYGDKRALAGLGLQSLGIPANWFTPKAARSQLANTPLVRQLRTESAKMGKRRSGKAAEAVQKAEAPFKAISTWTSGGSQGSDKPLNRAVAAAIAATLQYNPSLVVTEAEHPWLPGVIPDIRIDAIPDRYICIEMCYTNRSEPFVVADYVLRKLDRYMRQLQAYVDQR